MVLPSPSVYISHSRPIASSSSAQTFTVSPQCGSRTPGLLLGRGTRATLRGNVGGHVDSDQLEPSALSLGVDDRSNAQRLAFCPYSDFHCPALPTFLPSGWQTPGPFLAVDLAPSPTEQAPWTWLPSSIAVDQDCLSYFFQDVPTVMQYLIKGSPSYFQLE